MLAAMWTLAIAWLIGCTGEPSEPPEAPAPVLQVPKPAPASGFGPPAITRPDRVEVVEAPLEEPSAPAVAVAEPTGTPTSKPTSPAVGVAAVAPQPPASVAKPMALEPTPVPVVPKAAPVVPKAAPVVPKAAPVAPKAAPVAPQAAPVAPKPAPVAPKLAPVAPKPAPAEPRVAAVAPEPLPPVPVVPNPADPIPMLGPDPLEGMATCAPDEVEPVAQSGSLTGAQRGCMEMALGKVDAATKDRLSLALIANSYAAGDTETWTDLLVRHLNEIDATNPSLAYRLALHHYESGDAGNAYDLADQALANRAQWTRDGYASKTYAAHKLKSAAAQNVWKSVETQRAAGKADGEDARRAKISTGLAARAWHAYAVESGQDAGAAASLCRMADTDC